MANKTYRTCQNCGTVNLNRDYCKNCGEIININLKRKLEREQKAKEKTASEKVKKKIKSPSYLNTQRNMKMYLHTILHVSFIPFVSWCSP